MTDLDLGIRIVALKERIVANFTEEDWLEIGLLTGLDSYISNHNRLLRSLNWQDSDYASNALSVISQIAKNNDDAFLRFENYVEKKYPKEGLYISEKPSEKKITFAPNVFKVPEGGIDNNLVAIMMPFKAEFDKVNEGIKLACKRAGFECMRADDIWEESTVIQDIFNLIFRSSIVVVDFTGKNANVMYETGIAHTLGKHVIPITQSLDDVPFNMQHHRALTYLSNTQGIDSMVTELSKKLSNEKQVFIRNGGL